MKKKTNYDLEKKWLFQHIAIALINSGHWSAELAERKDAPSNEGFWEA